MEVTIKCSSCGVKLPVSTISPPDIIRCGQCNKETDLKFSNGILEDRLVDACPLCEEKDFYLRKDFDQKTGLMIIVVGALLSAVFYWAGMDLVAYGVLGCTTLLDFGVAALLGDVTVCYRCHTEFRGAYQRTAPEFDLHVADILEPEYERRIGLR